MYVLPLSGADIILGVQWLNDLGPITIDYNALTMYFSQLGQPATIQAKMSLHRPHTSAQQLKCLFTTEAVDVLFQLAIIPGLAQPNSSPTPIDDQ